uniref:Putative nuclease HARBI1 n=1 Tax=Meloidogyne javanica TaxID=6303 RepID=A0A915LMM5_MELJA
MAEFMNIQSNHDVPIRRREKGLCNDPIADLRRLSNIERDNELIKTYRFTKRVLTICVKTISKIILRVTKALADVSHKHIHLLDKSESSKVKREFLNYCGLPMIVGCIDCTHIRIRAPVSDEKSYVNRKGWHSLNVQVVCDIYCKLKMLL